MQDVRMAGMRRVIAVGSAGLVLVAGLAGLIASGGDSNNVESSTAASVNPTAIVETSTTTSGATTSGGRYSWQAGYSGLGPIRLGMTVEDATQAANAVARKTDGGCLVALDPQPGSEADHNAISLTPGVVEVIYIHSPRFHTISGIHIGSTADDVRRAYRAVADYTYGDRTALRIMDGQGRALYFPIRDDQVVAIWIAESQEALDRSSRC